MIMITMKAYFTDIKHFKKFNNDIGANLLMKLAIFCITLFNF